jgi:hypothetical protein
MQEPGQVTLDEPCRARGVAFHPEQNLGIDHAHVPLSKRRRGQRRFPLREPRLKSKVGIKKMPARPQHARDFGEKPR